MRINVTSVFVDDQDRALAFYTEVLGFVKKTEIPLGDAKWLTVVSPDDPEGTELLLEPDGHPAVRPFKRALVDDGIPFTSFAVDDAGSEFERLRASGVRFTQEPLDAGGVTLAVFDDTCGNLIRSPASRAEPGGFPNWKSPPRPCYYTLLRYRSGVRGYEINKDDYLKRLARIEGQVRGLRRMITEDKYCIDVLTQVNAASAALKGVAVGLLDEHVRHCVREAADAGDAVAADRMVTEATRAIERLVRS